MTSEKKSAIKKLREAREGKIKRTDQYEVSITIAHNRAVESGARDEQHLRGNQPRGV